MSENGNLPTLDDAGVYAAKLGALAMETVLNPETRRMLSRAAYLMGEQRAALSAAPPAEPVPWVLADPSEVVRFTRPPAEPMGWQPIETAPTDNKRPLYLARFNPDTGELQELDFDGIWTSESESWEIPKVYFYWASANGIEEPTHWAYQDQGGVVSHKQAAEALDSLDDYARMSLGVDAKGAREMLERYIAQQRDKK